MLTKHQEERFNSTNVRRFMNCEAIKFSFLMLRLSLMPLDIDIISILFKVLKLAGLRADEMDMIEINEAFSVVVLANIMVSSQLNTYQNHIFFPKCLNRKNVFKFLIPMKVLQLQIKDLLFLLLFRHKYWSQVS